MAKRQLRLDEIGYWSELKLEIVRKYAAAYSTILARKAFVRAHVYIDAFAGAGVHLSKATGEVFYNFMIMDANMNVFVRNPDRVSTDQAGRMDDVWGDNTWRTVAYRPVPSLFGDVEEKVSNEDIAEAFRQRLQNVAGFAYVPSPLPMRNSRGATVCYLYFASPDKTGGKIVTQIFDKYRGRGSS